MCVRGVPEGAAGLRGVETGQGVAEGDEGGQQNGQQEEQEEEVSSRGFEGSSLTGDKVPHQTVLLAHTHTHTPHNTHSVLTRHFWHTFLT